MHLSIFCCGVPASWPAVMYRRFPKRPTCSPGPHCHSKRRTRTNTQLFASMMA